MPTWSTPMADRPTGSGWIGRGLDGLVFWTRNIGPFLPHLPAVEALGVPFMVQFTVTGYDRALESSVPDWRQGVAQIRQLAERYGPRAVVWRYDPILMSSLTPADYHVENFARISRELEGAVDEACVSFAHHYAKTRRNLAAAARAHDFDWWQPEPADKRCLRHALSQIADRHGMTLTVCSQPELGGQAARCIDAGRLSDLAGGPIRARQKGNRPGCLCAESRDIGAYDSCPHGCVYCYAVSGRARTRARHKRHDPAGRFLVPEESLGDVTAE